MAVRCIAAPRNQLAMFRAGTQDSGPFSFSGKEKIESENGAPHDPRTGLRNVGHPGFFGERVTGEKWSGARAANGQQLKTNGLADCRQPTVDSSNEKKVKPKTQIPKPNPGHPPCIFRFEHRSVWIPTNRFRNARRAAGV